MSDGDDTAVCRECGSSRTRRYRKQVTTAGPKPAQLAKWEVRRKCGNCLETWSEDDYVYQ